MKKAEYYKLLYVLLCLHLLECKEESVFEEVRQKLKDCGVTGQIREETLLNIISKGHTMEFLEYFMLCFTALQSPASVGAAHFGRIKLIIPTIKAYIKINKEIDDKIPK